LGSWTYLQLPKPLAAKQDDFGLKAFNGLGAEYKTRRHIAEPGSLVYRDE